MFLAKMSINRPVMTTMAIIVFLIFGMISFDGFFGLMAGKGLDLNQVPKVEIPYINIMTIYPGAGPKEIETQVSKRIEDAVATVSEIKRLESYSLDGVSIVMIEFKMSKDVNVAFQEVNSKIDQIQNKLPDDAELPVVQKFDMQAFPIIDIVLSGDLDPIKLYEIADKELKDRFTQIKGVAQVQIVGGRQREIHVDFDNKTVFENSISLPQLLRILKAQNMDIPGGYLKIGGQELTVRLSGKYKDIDQISELEIPTRFGNKKLRQLASVSDAGKSVRERAVFFDNIKKTENANVVRLSLIKSSDGNAIKIAKEVYERLPEINEILPKGVSLKVVNDKSKFTKSTVDDTLNNILLGVLFTSIILLIFLHDLRSTLIVVLSMPTAIISTFIVVQMAGFSLNMMSLMGLSVSVGVLVSNSVVVLENIFRHKEMGEGKKEAAYKGTSEIAVAVIAATLTNVVVFVPLANISSVVGEFLREMALTAVFSTIFSLIMSFTLTPMLASLILPKHPKAGRFSSAMIRFEKMWERLYRRSLEAILKRWYVSLGIVIVSLLLVVVTTMIYGSKIGQEFMPNADNGQIKVDVELPVGYNLDETAKVITSIQNRLSKYPEIMQMVTNLGRIDELNLGTNLARMIVYLVDVKDRDKGISYYITNFIHDLADVPNANIKVELAEGMAGPGAPIEFYLLGQDLGKLEDFKGQIMDKIKDVPGLVNLDNSSRAGKPEITVLPKRRKLAEAGLTVMDIALTLRSSIEGMVSSQYSEHGNEYDIKVMLNDESVDTPDKIGNITVASQKGTYKLSELADVDYTLGFTKVLHRDKYTTIKFSASNTPDVATGTVIDEISRRIDGLNMPDGYRILWGGTVKMQQDMVRDLGFAFLLAFLLTYMLLAAILESFMQPVLILLTMFLAFIGVFMLMYYTDTNFGITANMGVIMLIGIVVNNAILMLDYTNQLVRQQGKSAKEALIEACPVKLKPIIMATLAIMLGMLPMALGIGDAGKEMRIPLGIVSIGGLASSTILTFWVIPAAYLMLASTTAFFKKLIMNIFGIEEGEKEAAIG